MSKTQKKKQKKVGMRCQEERRKALVDLSHQQDQLYGYAACMITQVSEFERALYIGFNALLQQS